MGPFNISNKAYISISKNTPVIWSNFFLRWLIEIKWGYPPIEALRRNGFRLLPEKSTASKPPVVRLSSASADFTQASKCRPTGRHFVCASCMQNKNAGPSKQTCVLLGKRGGKQHTGGNLVCVYPHTLWNNFTSREVKLMNLMWIECNFIVMWL